MPKQGRTCALSAERQAELIRADLQDAKQARKAVKAAEDDSDDDDDDTGAHAKSRRMSGKIADKNQIVSTKILETPINEMNTKKAMNAKGDEAMKMKAMKAKKAMTLKYKKVQMTKAQMMQAANGKMQLKMRSIFKPEGCGKCRGKVGCTPSCFA